MVDPPSRPAGPRSPRIVLAHDWLCGYRGGEGVLDRLAGLAEELGRAPALLVMFDDGRPLTPAIDRLPRIRSTLSRLPLASGRLRRWLLPAYPWAVADLSRRLARLHASEPVDLLVSSSSAAVKGLRAPPGVPHLCYCHAPARYVWSRREEYARGGVLRGAGLRVLGPRFRAWDRATAANVTQFIANSGHIAGQIEACYGRQATVVHPPVRTGFFTPDPGARREGFWLVVSALEPYKRVDVAVEAAARAGVPLVVVGDGSVGSALRARAGPGVRWLGRVSDERLRELYRTARALLHPQVEDFGIAAVEAQACGLPVAARGQGGALDTVADGLTGALAPEDGPAALESAARRCPDPARPEVARACRENAERFAAERFDERMRGLMLAALRPSGPTDGR